MQIRESTFLIKKYINQLQRNTYRLNTLKKTLKFWSSISTFQTSRKGLLQIRISRTKNNKDKLWWNDICEWHNANSFTLQFNITWQWRDTEITGFRKTESWTNQVLSRALESRLDISRWGRKRSAINFSDDRENRCSNRTEPKRFENVEDNRAFSRSRGEIIALELREAELITF